MRHDVAITGTWHKLVGMFRGVEATTWGGLLLGNVWPAYLFALVLVSRAVDLARSARPETLHQQAQLLQSVVTVVFLAVVAILFVIRRRTISGKRATWRGGAVALLGTFLLNAVAFLPVEDTTSTGSLLASSGIVIVGTLFTIWSLAILGRCFGLLPEVRGLVMRGPYRLVRHPVYLGELIAAIGLLFAKPHPVVGVLLVVFVVLQYWRTIYEEAALTAAYPSDYPAYARRVPRLVPGMRP